MTADKACLSHCVRLIPAADVNAFLRELLNFTPGKVDRQASEWTSVDAAVSKSTVLVLVSYRTSPAEGHVRKGQRQSQDRLYEDVSCSLCRGRGSMECPAGGCHDGIITDTVPDSEVVRTPLGQLSVLGSKNVSRICPTCRGTGRIHYPYCQNGTDPTLR
jgi:hypothetical protein